MGGTAKKRIATILAALGLMIAACFMTSGVAPKESSPEVAEERTVYPAAIDQEIGSVTEDKQPDKKSENSPEGMEDTELPPAEDERETDQPIEDEVLDAKQKEESQAIIANMVIYYDAYGPQAEPVVEDYLKELEAVAPSVAVRWERIMAVWKALDTELAIQYDVLPDGLPDTDELCIVALGFELNVDGTMKSELLGRLEVVKNSAEKYPNAWIVCTGGGTAAYDSSATEAGRMAEWLIEQGIEESRILVEDKSLTTVENAIFTYELLAEKAPQATKLAIVSSDYHIEAGALLFEAEAILQAKKPGEQRLTVLANAAYPAPYDLLSSLFQASALIDLSRNTGK